MDTKITREMRLKCSPKNYEDKNIKITGRLLSTWRVENGYSIADVAEFIASSHEEVVGMENGEIASSKKFLSYLLLADLFNIK